MRIVQFVSPQALFFITLILSACQFNHSIMTTRKIEPTKISFPTPTQAPIPPSPTSQSTAPAPTTENPLEAAWKNFYTPDFSAVHQPLDSENNEFLIFGNLDVFPPAENTSEALAAFLGRWEGVEIGAFGETGTQLILLVNQITPQDGTAYLWAGTDLQYPFFIKEIHFQVISGENPTIEWQADLTGHPEGNGIVGLISFSYDPLSDRLLGNIRVPPSAQVARTVELHRGQALHYFRDYARYLQSQRITFHAYKAVTQQRIGRGYAIYLPEDYESDSQKDWPLIVFLIGTGERGHSLSLLTKHGPLRVVLYGQSLPFIIASPMLEVSTEFRSFPEGYLDEMLKEILSEYRVDSQRIYLTGLSMGGEATYRYALHRPELFAALAPLAGFDPKYLPGATLEGFKPFTLPWERIKAIPVWAVHGAEDPIVPLSAAQKTVDAIRSAGGQVQFTVVEGGGHNIWTEIYSDPAFYMWLLDHSRSSN